MVALPKQETTLHAIDLAWQERERSEPVRGHLGASQIGRSCSRELWYSFRWVASDQFSGRMLRLFNRGHREEPAMIESLKMAGVTVHDVDPRTRGQFRFSTHGGHIAGSMDGCGLGFVEAPKTWHVLEFKTSGEKYFKKLVKGGVRSER